MSQEPELQEPRSIWSWSRVFTPLPRVPVKSPVNTSFKTPVTSAVAAATICVNTESRGSNPAVDNVSRFKKISYANNLDALKNLTSLSSVSMKSSPQIKRVGPYAINLNGNIPVIPTLDAADSKAPTTGNVAVASIVSDNKSNVYSTANICSIPAAGSDNIGLAGGSGNIEPAGGSGSTGSAAGIGSPTRSSVYRESVVPQLEGGCSYVRWEAGRAMRKLQPFSQLVQVKLQQGERCVKVITYSYR